MQADPRRGAAEHEDRQDKREQQEASGRKEKEPGGRKEGSGSKEKDQGKEQEQGGREEQEASACKEKKAGERKEELERKEKDQSKEQEPGEREVQEGSPRKEEDQQAASSSSSSATSPQSLENIAVFLQRRVRAKLQKAGERTETQRKQLYTSRVKAEKKATKSASALAKALQPRALAVEGFSKATKVLNGVEYFGHEELVETTEKRMDCLPFLRSPVGGRQNISPSAKADHRKAGQARVRGWVQRKSQEALVFRGGDFLFPHESDEPAGASFGVLNYFPRPRY